MRKLPVLNNDPEVLDRSEVDHLFHSWKFQPTEAPLRVVSANGVRFTTEDGRERLDFSSCFVSHNIGHQDPRVVTAIKDQADALCSFAPSFSTKPRAQLARALAAITPGDLSRSFISLGGTEANEAAIKIAHQVTGKRKVLSRYRSYHGGTAAAMTLSAGDPRRWSQVPGGTETATVPAAYCYRCPFGKTYPDCNIECAEAVNDVLEMEGGDTQVAALIVEPVVGANGVIVPPKEYLPRVREICDAWGVLLICDEVMTGFGRTGEWFAVDHWDVVPDILTMAKGITSGYLPLGVCTVREGIGEAFKDRFFGHGATYAAHAMCCAAALRVMQIYEEDDLITKSRELGAYLLEKSLELKDKHPSVGDVRGLGLFVGLELVKDRKTKEPMVPVRGKVMRETNPKLQVAARLAELGMMAMAANPSSVISMAPPLCVTKDEIDEGIAIMDEALLVADQHVV